MYNWKVAGYNSVYDKQKVIKRFKTEEEALAWIKENLLIVDDDDLIWWVADYAEPIKHKVRRA